MLPAIARRLYRGSRSMARSITARASESLSNSSTIALCFATPWRLQRRSIASWIDGNISFCLHAYISVRIVRLSILTSELVMGSREPLVDSHSDHSYTLVSGRTLHGDLIAACRLGDITSVGFNDFTKAFGEAVHC
jgi:hypothetical protein